MSHSSAIVLAAGKGTRMRSGDATSSQRAKVLHHFRGEPLVVHPIRAALAAAASPIVIVVGHGGAEVRDVVGAAFEAASSALRFAEQSVQRGTGHAVSCALAHLEGVTGPMLVLSGDVPLVRTSTLRALVDACARSPGGLALGVFRPRDATGYGRILRDERGDVVGIREQRDASAAERAITECNAGIYCVDAERLRTALASVGEDNAQGEIYLTDIVAPIAALGEVIAVELDVDEAAGVNTPEDLARLETIASERGA